MITVYVETFDITFKMKKGTSLYNGLEQAGIQIETPCGGKGICGKCTVLVDDPKNTPLTPHKSITDKDAEQGVRLACRLVPEKDISIKTTENFFLKQKADKGVILEARKISRKTLKPAAQIVCEDNKNFIYYACEENLKFPVSWKKSSEPKGFAIDIGTTTLAVSLVSLKTGEILASSASLNPQTRLGHDVLTRIQHASTLKGQQELTGMIQDELNRLLDETCQQSDSSSEEIIDITIGANTTMVELAAGIDPSPLGVLPFTVDIKGSTSYPADDFKLKVNPSARVYIPPVPHAYVGTDISAGLVCCPDFFDDSRVILFIDLGTNGEICLNARGKRLNTSTATGPAFEGMSISTGMRAENGAVDHVTLNGSDLVFHTIGNEKIKGICGSGILDFTAALLHRGDLDSTGRFVLKENNDEQQDKHHVVVIDKKKYFKYSDSLYISQKDIRQIQLAKSALRSGIDMMLNTLAIPCDQIDKIYLAGGFGKYLNPENMERIGIIPENTAEKLFFIGNASIDGSISLLTDVSRRRFLESHINEMEHLELGASPEFMDKFVKNLNFPEL
ncbi:MAG: ASKHA domain-containing protein [Desulfobacteraceae bacterium]